MGAYRQLGDVVVYQDHLRMLNGKDQSLTRDARNNIT
jgi:hypothetical protein